LCGPRLRKLYQVEDSIPEHLAELRICRQPIALLASRTCDVPAPPVHVTQAMVETPLSGF